MYWIFWSMLQNGPSLPPPLSTKCHWFHNVTFLGSYNIHIFRKECAKISVNQIRCQFRGVSFVTWSSHQVQTSLNNRYYSLRTLHTSVKNNCFYVCLYLFVHRLMVYIGHQQPTPYTVQWQATYWKMTWKRREKKRLLMTLRYYLRSWLEGLNKIMKNWYILNRDVTNSN